MTNSSKAFLALLGLAFVVSSAVLLQNYTDAIQERNDLERVRIEADRSLRAAEIEANRENVLMQIEAQKKADETRANDAKLMKYRDECRKEQAEIRAKYEDFLDTCTRIGRNTLQACIDSPLGKHYSLRSSDDWIQTCVDSKVWNEPK